MKQKKQTFVFGAFILMASGILVKIIGAVFKIPLTNLIGSEGMSYFGKAYSIYVTLYMISTAGIPVAVSKMVAASNCRGNTREVNRIFRLSYWLFFIIGLVGTVIMIVFSHQFAEGAHSPDSYLAMIAIAPTLFFICISSAYRGYFQGLQNMVPSAVSQVIESVGKMAIGLAAAWYFYRVLNRPLYQVAALVISGVTVGVFAATVYIAIVKLRHNRAMKGESIPDMPVRTSGDLLKELVVTSLPIALASSIMGLTNTVDVFVMSGQLVKTGITSLAAEQFYGVYNSIVITLLNMVPPLIYPFGTSVIPALSAAIAKGNSDECHKHISSALRITAILSIPCAIGMGTLSKGIISLLYREESIDTGFGTVMQIDLASAALSTVACAIFFLGVIAITNSVLQAYRYERYTIISTACGVLVKIVSTYFLSAVPGIGIVGAAIGTALCYFTIMMLNIVFLLVKVRYSLNIRKIYLKPAVCGIACGLSAFGVNALLGRVLSSTAIVTVVSIGAAAVVYFALILVMKGIDREDILMLPGGGKVCALLGKYNLIEKEENKA